MSTELYLPLTAHNITILPPSRTSCCARAVSARACCCQPLRHYYDIPLTRRNSISGFVSLQRETLSGEVFVVPNHVMRELYSQYFKVERERVLKLQ